MMSYDLASMTFEQIQDWMVKEGNPAYRGRQVFRWLHARAAKSFGEMTDLSLNFRSRLEALIELYPLEIVEVQQAPDGTMKMRYKLHDGLEVEGVLIFDRQEGSKPRTTLCVSTQVGCGMGCTFCATASMGFIRNLTAGEISGQLEAVQRHLKDQLQGPVTNVVFMGMGEPLANFEQVVCAIHILINPFGHGLSRRKVTISTAGIVPAMERFVREVPVKLAVSLNATTDELRNSIMPINRRFPLTDLISCCRNLPLQRTDRITFEYVLLSGINDTDQDARRLIDLLKGVSCKVNLIPYNPGLESKFARPQEAQVKHFENILSASSLSVFIRQSKGDSLQAACGQLVAFGAKEKGVVCEKTN